MDHTGLEFTVEHRLAVLSPGALGLHHYASYLGFSDNVR